MCFNSGTREPEIDLIHYISVRFAALPRTETSPGRYGGSLCTNRRKPPCSTRFAPLRTCVDSSRATFARSPTSCATTINAVSQTGGHLGAGLGVVELTVAMHYIFDTPNDRLIWDVGHQSLSAQDPDRAARPHPHAAPGRRPLRFHQAHRERIRSVRRRAFVDLDLRRPRHGGGARPRKRDNNVICVIGDGAMCAGMAYEAMNNAGAHRFPADRHPQRQRHVDCPADRRDVALSGAPASSGTYLRLRDIGKQLAKRLPKFLEQRAAAGRGVRPHLWSRRHAVRGTGLLLCRPDRRPRSDAPAAGAQERARHQAGPDPGARRHQEGQGLRARRELGRQVPRRRQVRCHHRRAGEA